MKKSDDDSGGRLWDRDEIDGILAELQRATGFGPLLYRKRKLVCKVPVQELVRRLARLGYAILEQEYLDIETGMQLPLDDGRFDDGRFIEKVCGALSLGDDQKQELHAALRLDALRDAFSALVAGAAIPEDEALGLLFLEVQILRQAGLLN